MAETKGLDAFCAYVGEQSRATQQVYAEIEEVQKQLNEFYREKQAAWQAAMAKTVPMLGDGSPLPAALAQSLLTVTAEERAKLEVEIADLAASVKAKRAEADSAIAEAQAEVATLRQENPKLDAEEEAIKARCEAIRQEILRIEDEIKASPFLSGVLQRRRLRKERDQRSQALVAETRQLRQVRQTWEDEKKRFQQDQSRLHEKWDSASVEAAQLQARLDYLRSNLERLSQQNGAGRYLAELGTVPEAPEPLRKALAEMVELNRVKGEYEEGLRTVAEALGLLKGLADGMDRFQKSADKVLEEQRQYGLKELHIQLGDEVLSFHALWPEFRAQVKDEKTLGTHPVDFSQCVHAIIRDRLADAAIARMFESMGDALTQATKAWG